MQEREKVFVSNHTIIEYDPRGFLYVKGKGYIKSSEWQSGGMYLLKLMMDRNISSVIIDQSKMKGTWLPRLSWLKEHFLPKLTQINHLKQGFIYSKDNATIHSLNRFLEIVGMDHPMLDIQAFENQRPAIDWLLDEIDEETESPKSLETISIRSKSKHQIIHTNDIYYIQATQGKLEIVTADRKIYTNNSLSKMSRELPKNIQQIHRSFLLNVNHLEHIEYYAGGAYKAYLKNEESLPVGRKYAQQLKQYLGIDGNW